MNAYCYCVQLVSSTRSNRLAAHCTILRYPRYVCTRCTRCSSNVPGMSYCTRYHTNCSYSLLSRAQVQVNTRYAYEHTSTSTSSICSEPSISRRTPSHHSIISSNIRYMTVPGTYTPFSRTTLLLVCAEQYCTRYLYHVGFLRDTDGEMTEHKSRRAIPACNVELCVECTFVFFYLNCCPFHISTGSMPVFCF